MSREKITAEHIQSMLLTTAQQWQTASHISGALDAKLGDGDHGHALANGMAAAAEQLREPKNIPEMFMTTASSLMNRMGGAAGALLGSFFLGMATATQEPAELTLVDFSAMCSAGCAAVKRRSRAEMGDKTLLDALEPAIHALASYAEAGASIANSLQEAAKAADTGANATIAMTAKHGRAKFLGERSTGHMDPGAHSVSVMFHAWHIAWQDIEGRGG
ncbi:MAG: dihydroxyacetone kinase subunit DhaL [Chloroflexi bacterium]|nr:dihydroxyacetone kinase subunit DhaL [Chloroflexota bacterium]